MSLFTKTVFAGFSKTDAELLRQVFDGIGERFREHDKEIEALRQELAAIKREPRTSLNQRLRTKL